MNSTYLLDGDNFSRNNKMYAELQRLQLGATCESLPADARGKSQIVFYLGARTCLSSRSHPLDHSRAESFGGCIDRSRETCRTGPDNGNITDHFGIWQFRYAQLICQLRNRRTLQDPSVRDYDFWQ